MTDTQNTQIMGPSTVETKEVTPVPPVESEKPATIPDRPRVLGPLAGRPVPDYLANGGQVDPLKLSQHLSARGARATRSRFDQNKPQAPRSTFLRDHARKFGVDG